MAKDERPRCPRCGEPARTVLLRGATVECELARDGSIGPVVRARVKGAELASYVCGGGHEWKRD